jgi:hypothetical protein
MFFTVHRFHPHVSSECIILTTNEREQEQHDNSNRIADCDCLIFTVTLFYQEIRCVVYDKTSLAEKRAKFPFLKIFNDLHFCALRICFTI